MKIVYLLIFYSFLVRFKFQHTFYSYNAVEIRWIYIFFGVLDGQLMGTYLTIGIQKLYTPGLMEQKGQAILLKTEFTNSHASKTERIKYMQSEVASFLCQIL